MRDRAAMLRAVRAELSGFVTIAGALALLGLFVGAFVSAVHLAPPDSHGVVGWITTHHYSKPQEFLTWIVALAAAVAIGFGVARLDRLPGLGAGDGLIRLWLALPAIVLAAVEAAWWGPPPAVVLFLAALVYTACVPVVLLLRGSVRAAAPSAEEPHGADDGTQAPDERGYLAALAVALAGANGLLLSWYVPVLLGAAFGFAGAVVPITFALLAWRLARARESSAIAFATGTSPLALLVLAPLFALAPFVLAVTVAAAVATAMLLRRDVAAARNALPYAAVTTYTALWGFIGLSPNPRLLPGLRVSPLDGDAFASWMSDGLHAHVVFRDFWYPYGPLEFVQHFGSAVVFGLDRSDTPYQIFVRVCSALLVVLTARALFGRTALVPLAAAIAIFTAPPEPRLWLPFAATAFATSALRSGRRGTAAAAGALSAASVLLSPEAGAVALVAFAGVFVLSLIARRAARNDVLAAAACWAAGLGTVLLGGAIAGFATGTAGAYLQDVTRLAAIVDACCGQAYPSVFGGFNGVGGPPAWLLDPTYAGFFAIPAVFLAAVLVLALRFFRTQRLSADDATLAAVALFGALMFRSALGRSEAGHLWFVAPPAITIALIFLQRSLSGARRPLTAACAVVLIVILPFAPSEGASKLVTRAHELASLGPALAARAYTPAQYAPVKGGDRGRFLVSPADAADVARVRDDLRARLRPGDGLYAVPYASRYAVMLDLASPGRTGPALWAAYARPEDQRELARELVNVRLVVYDESEWPDSDAVPWIDRYPIVAAAVRTSYRPVARFGAKIVYERGTPPPPPRDLDLGRPEALSSLIGGWYAEESMSGRPGRWSTADATLALTPAAGDDGVALDFIALEQPAQPRTLEVAAGAKAPTAFRLTPGVQRLVYDLPAPHTAGPITLALRSSAALDVPDKRILGIFVLRAATGSARALRASVPRGAVLAAASTPAPAASASASPAGAPFATATAEVALPKAVAAGSWRGGVLTVIVPGRRPETIEFVQALTSTALNGAGACYVNVKPAAGAAFLAKDSGTEWNAAVPLGKPGSQANASCAFDAARSSVAARGNDTVVRLALALRSRTAEPLRTWVRASDQGEDWTAVASTPAADGAR